MTCNLPLFGSVVSLDRVVYGAHEVSLLPTLFYSLHNHLALRLWHCWSLLPQLLSSLMGISFAIGVAITALIAFLLLLPMAVTGMTMGMVGLASASAHATTNALYAGDSATRLAVLTQLQQTIDAEPSMTLNDQSSAWILPAIEQCKADIDPDVVSLAEKLGTNIKDRTLPPPQ